MSIRSNTELLVLVFPASGELKSRLLSQITTVIAAIPVRVDQPLEVPGEYFEAPSF